MIFIFSPAESRGKYFPLDFSEIAVYIEWIRIARDKFSVPGAVLSATVSGIGRGLHNNL